MRKITLALATILITALCSAQGKYPSILWEITKPGMAKPSYLFGTYHISNKGVFKLGDSLFYALQNVDIVAKEVNANTWQEEQFKMEEMENAYFSYKGSLRDITVTENTFKKTNTIEKLPAFLGLTPNFINYFLYRNNAVNEGFEEEMYLDRFISSTGYKYGKEVKGLENYLESNILGLEGQKDADDEEKKDYKKIPGDISYREMNDKIYDGYLNNSLNAMDSFMIYQYQSEAYFKKFVLQRNYNQADSLDYYIKTGKSVFGAVGCAHLPGEEGVIEILRKKGYSVRPVELKYKDNEKLDVVKKMIVPMPLGAQQIDDVISFRAPGTFYPYNRTDILKTYGYVDMKNGAFYLVSRLYNNALWFGYDANKVASAIDSLSYSSIKGNITSKKVTVYKGMPCVDITAQVKNKDVERYKILVTPYEIIEFRVGGKNEYAKSNFVDEFFNSIDVKPEQPLADALSFGLKNKPLIHQWKNTSSGYIQNKQRFAYYDTKNNQLNTVIKNVLPEGAGINDSLTTHLIRESVLLSDAFSKNLVDDFSKLPLNNTSVQKLQTKTGNTVLLKYVLDYPVVYVITSVSNNAPDASFIESFYLQPYKPGSNYTFTDMERGFTVTLPFVINPDALWKKQTDRVRKKYDDEKDPNANRNLFYYPSTYGNNYIFDGLIFEDKENMETINLDYYRFDSSCYYPGTSAFWKHIIKKHETRTQGSSSTISVSSLSGYNNSSSGATPGKKPKILDIKYDTASKSLQKVSFNVYDSVSKKTTAFTYFLSSNKLHIFSWPVWKKEPTAFQQQVLGSFKPLDTKQAIAIYQPKLNDIVKEYFAATKIKQPAVLNKLNNIRLGINNIKQADSLFNTLLPARADKNILRRKVMDMVAEGLYDDKEWKTVTAWFQKIYNNKDMLTTLRSFALGRIIDRPDADNAGWLIDNFVNTGNSFQKRFDRELMSFMRNVYPKTNLLNRAKLLVKDKEDFYKFSLIDSNWYSIADRNAAFAFYKKSLEDEALDMQISQEKKDFEFNEKELSETAAGDEGSSNFKTLLDGFSYFYRLNPSDPFFDNAFKKITSSNSDDDILSLLNILLKEPKGDITKIHELVKLAVKGNKNLYDVNKAFYINKKYDKLADSLKDKQAIARQILLDDRGRYSKLDSLVFLGTEKNPFNSNEIFYFFKYIKERETNANIAYVILDNENAFLKEKPALSFTTDQVTIAEPYSKIAAKLMRKHYTGTYFKRSGSFYSQSSSAKSLNSEE